MCRAELRVQLLSQKLFSHPHIQRDRQPQSCRRAKGRQRHVPAPGIRGVCSSPTPPRAQLIQTSAASSQQQRGRREAEERAGDLPAADAAPAAASSPARRLLSGTGSAPGCSHSGTRRSLPRSRTERAFVRLQQKSCARRAEFPSQRQPWLHCNTNLSRLRHGRDVRSAGHP